jgi:hypothetical protein
MRKFAKKKTNDSLRSKEEKSAKKKNTTNPFKKNKNKILNGGLSMLCCHFHIPKDLGRHFEKNKPLFFVSFFHFLKHLSSFFICFMGVPDTYLPCITRNKN